MEGHRVLDVGLCGMYVCVYVRIHACVCIVFLRERCLVGGHRVLDVGLCGNCVCVCIHVCVCVVVLRGGRLVEGRRVLDVGLCGMYVYMHTYERERGVSLCAM